MNKIFSCFKLNIKFFYASDIIKPEPDNMNLHKISILLGYKYVDSLYLKLKTFVICMLKVIWLMFL